MSITLPFSFEMLCLQSIFLERPYLFVLVVMSFLRSWFLMLLWLMLCLLMFVASNMYFHIGFVSNMWKSSLIPLKT
jgi:hypothetical protein